MQLPCNGTLERPMVVNVVELRQKMNTPTWKCWEKSSFLGLIWKVWKIKNAPCFTFSKSLKYPQIRCKSSTTSTIPTALRFQMPSSMCEIAIARCRRTRTPRVVGFRGWSFFSEPIVMAEAAIHSNVVICQVPYHPCMACLPTLTYMYHQHVPSRSSKCGWFLWYR